MTRDELIDLQRLLGELETRLAVKDVVAEDEIEYIRQVSEIVGREAKRG